MAADLPAKAPPPVVANDWSGFYLGAHGGYGWGHDPFDQTFVGIAPFTLFIPGATVSGVDSKGYVAGGHAGYNWQYRDWIVAGLEIDLSATGIKGSITSTATASSTFISGTNTQILTDKLDWLGSARARLGILAGPNLLLYGTGGLAWTRLIQSFRQTITTDFGGTVTTSTAFSSTPSWRFGWVAGVGAEARVLDSNWLVRVEYLHYDFGDSGSQSPAAGGAPGFPGSTATSFESGNMTADVVRAGLSYKFGGGPLYARY